MGSAGGRADEQPGGQSDAQARRPRHTGPADPGSYQPPDDAWGPAGGPVPPPPRRTAAARPTPRTANPQRAPAPGHRTVPGTAAARRPSPARAVPARSPPTGGRAAAWHVPRPRRCIFPGDRPSGRLRRPEGRLARGLTAAEGPDPGLPPHAGPGGPRPPAPPVLRVGTALPPRPLAGHERPPGPH